MMISQLSVCLYKYTIGAVRHPSHTEGSGYQSTAWSIPPLSGYKLNTLGMQQTYLKLMYKEVIIIEMHQNNTNFQVGLTLRQGHQLV